MGIQRRFADAITEQEVACGFDIVEHTTGESIVRVDLGAGIYAMKVHTDDGGVEYLVCDENLTQLYTPASSLTELKERFLKGDRKPRAPR